MGRQFLNTYPLREVTKVLLARPDESHYAQDVCERSGLGSGTVTAILHRLTVAGWLVDAGVGPSDVVVTTTAGARRRGSPRRYYRLTPAGVAGLQGLLAAKGKR